MEILKGNRKKRVVLVGILLLLALVPAFSAPYQNKVEEVRSYFRTLTSEDYGSYYRISYSFRELESFVLASEEGIEVASFRYLSNAEINTILAESWIQDSKGYNVDNKTTAETVVEAIRRYLDKTYPYTGEVTAEKVSSVFDEMVTVSLCPYQDYSIQYFNLENGLISQEVDYYDAVYSMGTKISYVNRLVEDFGVGMSVETNLTFDTGEVFGNITPTFDLSSVLFRYKTVEVVSTLGFGGFITINESSLSFIPGMSASVGVQFTVDENMVFRIEAGLDAGLWLWKTMSANGFMMVIQKPIMFGVGVHV